MNTSIPQRKISIALAAYNGEKYIGEQIESILRQTYQNFELIVCDDCSTDSTWTILKEYSKKDKRVICYLNERNIGFTKNFEKAISLCGGEYIALSDQDDIWTEDHLEILMNNVSTNMLICSQHQGITKDGIIIEGDISNQQTRKLFRKGDNSVFLFLLFHNFAQGCAMLISGCLAKIALPFPKEFLGHDHWFALVAGAYRSITFIDKTTVFYRHHENNVTRVFYTYKKKKERKPFREKWKDSQRTYKEWILENLIKINAFYSLYKDKLTSDQNRICTLVIDYLLSTIKKTKMLKRIYYFVRYYDILHFEDENTSALLEFPVFLWKLFYRVIFVGRMVDDPRFEKFIKHTSGSDIAEQD